jgi:hypothetical protein
MRRTATVLASLLLGAATATFAATINVPADQPTIQAGINAAANGDTVLVAPGTYFENINFMGKAITVKSSGGSKVTIIDGQNLAPVVTFAMGEGSKSIVSGFTLQNGNSGFSTQYEGGGVYIAFTSPTVQGNVIQHNSASSGSGGGIGVYFGSPILKNNLILNNIAGIGGGIDFGGASDVTILHNTIVGNSATEFGGGISIDAAGNALIEDNKIMRNNGATEGGGVWVVNEADEVFVQNLIVGNTASQGGGVYLSVPASVTGMLWVNNTIANNNSADGSAVWAGGFDDNDTFWNNLIIGSKGQTAFVCDATYDPNPPIIQYTDAYAANGTGFQGSCGNDAGQNGNISLDPLFVSGTNFQLQASSPVIDMGSNSAPDLPKKDLAGKPRIVDGDGDGDTIIDMGAYEFQPH